MRNNTLRLLALSFLGLSLFSDYASGMNEKKENKNSFEGLSIGELRSALHNGDVTNDNWKDYVAAMIARKDEAGYHSLVGQARDYKKKGFKGKGVTNSSSNSKKEQRKDESKDDNNGGGGDGQPADELSPVLQKWGKGEAVTEFADVRGVFRKGYNQVNLDALKQGAYVQKGEDATGKGKEKAGKIDPTKDLKEDAVFTVYGAGGKLLNKPLASFVCFDQYTKDDLDDLGGTAWTLKVNGTAGDAAEPYELFVALLKEYIKED